MRAMVRTSMTGRIGLAGALAAIMLTACGSATGNASAKGPDAIPAMRGVNLAGGEFAPERMPGVFERDYIYPTKDVAAPFLKAGMDTVRLPVLWERIQPEPYKPLSDTEMKRVEASLASLKGFRAIILDVHNYARYRGERLDRNPAGSAMLADLWTRLAERYKGRKDIVFGIMNEPYDISAQSWRGIVDETVLAIRDVGATNLILVSGTRWSGAHSWMAGEDASNAAAFADFQDPGDNFLFDLHQYLDDDSSGKTGDCVSRSIGEERVKDVTHWLRQRKMGAILGEIGTGQDATCLAALDNMLTFMDANGDVWRGWTYWAGGGWWGDYPLSIQPGPGGDKPQAGILSKHLPKK